MAAGSRRAVRGAVCVTVGLAGALMAGLLFSGQDRQTGPRGIVDPVGSGLAGRTESRPLAPEAAPIRIVLGPEGRDVRLSGELTEGAAERLAGLLDAHRTVERIHLTSEGGLVDEGAAIGALIAERGLVTYVPDYCVSACTLAFVRGRERLVLADARLGFHAPYETDSVGSEFAVDSAPERAAYLAAGVRADFVDAALTIRPDDLMIPDADTLVKAGVATGIVDAYRFPDSTLDDGDTPERVRRVILHDVPLLDAVEAGAPGTVAPIAAWYLDGYHRGRPEGEAVDGVRRMAAHAVARSLADADPAALDELGRMILRAMQRPNPDRARVCAAAREGAGAVLTRPRLDRTQLAAGRAILARALGLRPAEDSSKRAAVEALAATGSAPPVPGRGCSALRKAFAAALARPVPESAQALRPLLFPAPPARLRPPLEASALPP
ncbi:COG3904 family protein [Methylorubrum podarium]